MSIFHEVNTDGMGDRPPYEGPSCRIGHLGFREIEKASITGAAAGLTILAAVILIKSARWFHRRYAFRFHARFERRSPAITSRATAREVTAKSLAGANP